MDMTVFNVGFGQSILMEEEGDQLLVDCGSSGKNASKKYEATISCIREQMQYSRRKLALLTHYHEDHYSFFSELDKQSFDGVYLPCAAFKRNRETGELECVFVEETILGYILGASCKKDAEMFLCNQIRMLLDLVKDNGWIAVPRRGDIFHLGKTKCEVLWPDISENAGFSIHEEKRRKQIQDIKSFLSDYLENWELFNQIRDNIINELYNFYRSISDITGIIEEDNYVSGQMRHRDLEEQSYLIKREELEGIFERQTGNIKKLGDISASILESFKEKNQVALRSLRSRVSRIFNEDNNAISIVFQDMIEKEDYASNQSHRFLLTGDITKKIIKKRLFTHRTFQVYTVIQCPHHGTRSHFSDALPSAKQLIISNKKYGNHGCISFLYGHYYPFLVARKYIKCMDMFAWLYNRECLVPFKVKHLCTNADSKTCESLRFRLPCLGCTYQNPSEKTTIRFI